MAQQACVGAGGAQAPPGRIAGRLGAPAGAAGGSGMPGLGRAPQGMSEVPWAGLLHLVWI